jgi:hypothetical protein
MLLMMPQDYLGMLVDVATGEAEFASAAEKQTYTDANAKRLEWWKRSSSFTLHEEVLHAAAARARSNIERPTCAFSHWFLLHHLLSPSPLA